MKEETETVQQVGNLESEKWQRKRPLEDQSVMYSRTGIEGERGARGNAGKWRRGAKLARK